MASLSAGRAVRFTLLLAVLLFLGLLVHALFSVPAADVLPVFRLKYSLWLALERLIDLLLAVQVGGVLLAASLPVTSRRQPAPAGAFHARMGPLLVGLFVLSAVYALVVLGLSGEVRRNVQAPRVLSHVARELERRLDTETKQENFAAAADLAGRLLQIDPGNRKMIEEHTRLKILQERALARASVSRGAAVEAEIANLQVADREVEGLLARARSALDRGDAFTAFYYASLGRELDGKSYEAGRLESEARVKIASLAPRDDPAAADRYRRKKEGSDALGRGDVLTAYRVFRELEQESPKDPEIAELARESLERAQSVSFFVEDAALALLQPGRRGIVFLNGTGAEEREVVYLERVVESSAGVFLENVEALRFRPDGRLIRHLRAPLGRLDGKAIQLRGVSRTDGSVRVRPEYLTGAPRQKGLDVLPLAGQEDLLPFLTAGEGWDTVSLSTLLRIRTGLRQLGWGRQELELEVFGRAVAPLSFLVLSLLALALGWSFRGGANGADGRSRPSRLPPHYVLLAPAVLAAAFLGVSLYASGCCILSAFLLLRLGFRSGFLVLAGVHLALLLASLALLAGQRPDEP